LKKLRNQRLNYDFIVCYWYKLVLVYILAVNRRRNFMGVITGKDLVGDVRITDIQYDNYSDTLVWREERGTKGVLVARQAESAPCDITRTLSVKSQGYGSGDFTVFSGVVYFVALDGRLYKQSLGVDNPIAMTPEEESASYPAVSPDGKALAYISSVEGNSALNVIEEGFAPRKLFDKTDFITQPAWHPSSRSLAIVTWDHHDGAWGNTKVYLVDLEGKTQVVSDKKISGVFLPEFAADGTLYYIGEKDDFAQIFAGEKQITHYPGEHKTLSWFQGRRTYCIDGKNIYFIRQKKGVDTLWCYSEGKEYQIDAGDYLVFSQITTSKNGIVVLASAPNIPERIVEFPSHKIIKHTSAEKYTPLLGGGVEHITWRGIDGEEVHGIYYPPEIGEGTPPLLVHVHGGPMSQDKMAYNDTVLFFSRRGFACLQVNYRGSTGYGKKYTQKLYGNWGVYDVEDAASGAMFLVQRGLADKERMAIIGRSAGGSTVLNSLVNKPGLYKAGICLFGVSNQIVFRDEIKKMHYCQEALIGDFSTHYEHYHKRSPCFYADKITEPLMLFHGTADKVVFPSQTKQMVQALQRAEASYEYHFYEGEGHGWRKPETIKHFHENVLRFLEQHVL
jgi:dipeptidyl aminopeptidase/acylaminoacyl peptidase